MDKKLSNVFRGLRRWSRKNRNRNDEPEKTSLLKITLDDVEENVEEYRTSMEITLDSTDKKLVGPNNPLNTSEKKHRRRSGKLAVLKLKESSSIDELASPIKDFNGLEKLLGTMKNKKVNPEKALETPLKENVKLKSILDNAEKEKYQMSDELVSSEKKRKDLKKSIDITEKKS